MGWGGWGCRAEQRSDGVEIRCAVVFLMQQWAVRDANETLLLLLLLLLVAAGCCWLLLSAADAAACSPSFTAQQLGCHRPLTALPK